jgi:hypothetical protein
MPTQERLRELFTYKAETGQLLNKVHRQRLPVGWPVGYINDGYFKLRVDNRVPAYLHRLIWVYHHGVIPKGKLIDHTDRNPLNNCIENLRLATPAENQLNRRDFTRRYSVRLGVSWNSQSKAWRALITVDRRRIYLGQFKDKAKAIHRRQLAERLYGRERVVQSEAA